MRLGVCLLTVIYAALVEAVPQRVAYNINSGARLIRVEERVGSREAAAQEAPSLQEEPSVGDEGAAEAQVGLGGDASRESVPAQPSSSSHGPDDFPCHQMVAAADVPFDTNCSEQCPYWAESALKSQSCQFKCVTELECGTWGQGVVVNASVADKKGYCRRCRVSNCNMCHAHQDACVDCKSGYHLYDGSCVSDVSYISYATYIMIILLTTYLILWYIEIRCRPVVNMEGVERGLKFRSLTKLRLPKQTAAPAGDARTPLLSAPAEPAAPPAAAAVDAAPEAAVEVPTPATEPAAATEAGGAAPPPAATPGTAEAADGGDAAGGQTRPLWPLTTNLLKEPAGGVGATLLFRFQFYWIFWGFFTLLLWVGIAAGHNKELFVLGIEEVGTPRELCKLVIWGTTMLRDNMHIKVRFMSSLYACTFVGSVVFAILQARMHKALDKNTTMKDFAAMVYGLPKIPGTVQVEKELQDLLQVETGERVVGVSVAWDIRPKGETIRDVLEEDLHRLEEPPPEGGGGHAAAAAGSPAVEAAAGTPAALPPPPDAAAPTAAAPGTTAAPEGQAAPLIPTVTLDELDRPIPPMEYNGFRWKFFGLVDRLLLMAMGVPREAAEEEVNQEALATEMETTPFAFAVFESEIARDKAVHILKGKGGAVYKEAQIRMKIIDSEPESVQWHDLGYPKSWMPLRVFRGVLIVLFSLFCWGLFFYLPYVLYLSAQEYDATNQSPDTAMFFVLMFVVLGSNVLMYTICAIVAEQIHFHFVEDMQSSYLIFYLSSVVLNVSLDMCVASWISYKAMVSAGAHTFGGKFLGDAQNIQEIYESYPVQKNLGYQLFGYNFPSTFLLPFVLEPLLMIYIPYHLMYLIVRTNPTIKGWRAEKAMSIFMPMDTGRYGDVLVNILLTVLILFAPGGWFARTFAALIGSNIFIYIYDQYRVLRCVPGFTYSNNTIDKFALKLSAIPCGIILSCLLLKANCMKNGQFCVGGVKLTALCVEAFILHCVVHVAALTVIPPLCVPLASTRSEVSYAEAAKTTGATWFSTNPAYCLRSKMVYKHSPPCPLFVRGKEHVLPANPVVGQHFQDTMAAPEKY